MYLWFLSDCWKGVSDAVAFLAQWCTTNTATNIIFYAANGFPEIFVRSDLWGLMKVCWVWFFLYSLTSDWRSTVTQRNPSSPSPLDSDRWDSKKDLEYFPKIYTSGMTFTAAFLPLPQGRQRRPPLHPAVRWPVGAAGDSQLRLWVRPTLQARSVHQSVRLFRLDRDQLRRYKGLINIAIAMYMCFVLLYVFVYLYA